MKISQVVLPAALIVLGFVGTQLFVEGSGIQTIAYNLIQNAGTPLTKRSTLNFTGAGVTCSDGSSKTTCDIPGGGGTAVAPYRQTFTTQTSVVLTDNLNTTSKQVQCTDAGSPPLVLIPQDIALTDANNTTVTFTSTQSGACVVIGGSATTVTVNNHSLLGGSAPVASSCGTSPAVVAGSTDNAGTVTIGAGVSVTGCTLTFATAFTTAPSCTVTTNSLTALGDVSAVSTSAVTISFVASLATGTLYYHCF